MSTSESHSRMLASLNAIRSSARLENPFFEVQSIQRGESVLAELERERNSAEAGMVHAMLAREYRRTGDLTRAVEHGVASEAARRASILELEPEVEHRFLYESGVTYLRVGETENCVHCQNGESCILPLQGGGTHQDRLGSRQAIEFFNAVLANSPDDLSARWLLNIASMTLGEYPEGVPAAFRLPVDSFQSQASFPRFPEIAGDVGLRQISCSGGVIADDFDDDGLIDVMASDWAPDAQLRLFHNAGDGTFEDQSESAGLTGLWGGLNLIQADYDNDGDRDVLVMRGAWLGVLGRHPDSLLENLGGGRFRDVTFQLGLADFFAPTPTAAWADIDNDGDLDLFVGHEVAPCQLYRNDGPAGFQNITSGSGLTNDRYTKAAVWGDYDGDRLPDLYVSNYRDDNRLYHNNGDGSFTDAAPELHVTGPNEAFPAWFWDVNNDGRLDLFVASYNMGVEHTAGFYFGAPRTDEPDCLYLGTALGGFVEAAERFGITHESQPMGANFGDLDNDGYPDFYMGTGCPAYDALMPNLMYHNRDGQRFEDVTIPGGFGHLQKGHGVAFADFDNDGDQDVFEEMGGAFPGDAYGNVLYENPGFHNHWLRIKLHGIWSNRDGIGARIRADIVEGGVRRSVYQWVNSGGSFGANPLEPHLGLGRAERVERLAVDWPTSGVTQTFENVPVDCAIEIREDRPGFQPRELRQVRLLKPAAANATGSGNPVNPAD